MNYQNEITKRLKIVSEESDKHIEALNDMLEISPEAIIAISEHKGVVFAGLKEDGKKDNNREIKTNQIRNFYSSIIEMKQDMLNNEENTQENNRKVYSKLVLLQPKLAYAAGRQVVVKDLYLFVQKAILGVAKHKDDDENFKKAMNNFFDLIESVVAYHKFYGGN